MIYITGKKEAVEYIKRMNINLESSRLKSENYKIRFDIEDSCVKLYFEDNDSNPSSYDYGGNYETLYEFIRGITDLITGMGFVNLDFEDVESVFRKAKAISFCSGTGEGENRAEKAGHSAAEKLNIKPESAEIIMMNVTTGTEITLSEMSDVVFAVENSVSPDAMVIWGHVIDESFGDSICVKIYAVYDPSMNNPA